MNFYFEEGDIVTLRESDGMTLYILVKGFDKLPKGYRIWWADPWDGKKTYPGKRIRTYSNCLIRIRRPKEEQRLKERAERWKQVRLIASFTCKARTEIKERARLRKRGIALNDTPFGIPSGKWVSPEGLRQIMEDVGFKPETIEKRVKIMERVLGRK